MNAIAGCPSDVWNPGAWLALGMTLTSPTTWRVVTWLMQVKTLLRVLLGQAARPRSSDALRKAQVTLGRARQALNRDDMDAALSFAHIAYEQFDLASDRVGAAQSLIVFGQVLSRLGEVDAARDAVSRSLSGLKPGEDRATALTLLADIYAAQGNFSAASHHYQQALMLARRLGLRHREAQIAPQLAFALYEQEQWAAAETLYRQALALADELNLRSLKPSLLLEIGNTLAQQGQTAEARRWLERSIAHARTGRNQRVLADALHSLATVCALDGDPHRARTLYALVIDLRHANGDVDAATSARHDLALVARATGSELIASGASLLTAIQAATAPVTSAGWRPVRL